MQTLVVKDPVHEEVLFEAVYRLGVDPEDTAAGLVSQADRRLTLLAVLHGAPHEKFEHGARVLAVIDAFGKRQESATSAELTDELKLYKVNVDDASVDK